MHADRGSEGSLAEGICFCLSRLRSPCPGLRRHLGISMYITGFAWFDDGQEFDEGSLGMCTADTMRCAYNLSCLGSGRGKRVAARGTTVRFFFFMCWSSLERAQC